jgi:hypothetical protein
MPDYDEIDSAAAKLAAHGHAQFDDDPLWNQEPPPELDDLDPFDEPPPPLEDGALAKQETAEPKTRAEYLKLKLREKLLDSAGLDTLIEPISIVGPEFLYTDTLNWLVGKPGHGKSFVALDLAGCVATGSTWHQRDVVRSKVLYIAAEGVRGVRQRVRAWESEHGIRMTGVDFLPIPVQSTNAAHWQALVDIAADIRYGLIVVDTQARVTVGVEENSNKEMGTFVHQAEELRKAAGACVILVHHVGSGSSRDGTVITLTCQKNKDGAEWDPVEFFMTPVGKSIVLRTQAMIPQNLVHGCSPDALRTAKRWWDHYEDEWSASGALVEVTEQTRATFARHRKELERFGYAARVEYGRSYRYRLTGDPSVPPDQRPPAEKPAAPDVPPAEPPEALV